MTTAVASGKDASIRTIGETSSCASGRLSNENGDLSHLAEAERFAASPMLSERLRHNVEIQIRHLRDRLSR